MIHNAVFTIIIISLLRNSAILCKNLSYDKLILIRSPSEIPVIVAYNISQIGQHNLWKFVNKSINCPLGIGRIAELPWCYRVIALDPYDYQCCDENSKFVGLHLYPFTLNETEARYLLNNLTLTNAETKGLMFLHIPTNNNDRSFKILNNFEINILKRFTDMIKDYPADYMETSKNDTKCYKRISAGALSACYDKNLNLIGLKAYSNTFDKKEELKALMKTLNDKIYFKSLVMEQF